MSRRIQPAGRSRSGSFGSEIEDAVTTVIRWRIPTPVTHLPSADCYRLENAAIGTCRYTAVDRSGPDSLTCRPMSAVWFGPGRASWLPAFSVEVISNSGANCASLIFIPFLSGFTHACYEGLHDSLPHSTCSWEPCTPSPESIPYFLEYSPLPSFWSELEVTLKKKRKGRKLTLTPSLKRQAVTILEDVALEERREQSPEPTLSTLYPTLLQSSTVQIGEGSSLQNDHPHPYMASLYDPLLDPDANDPIDLGFDDDVKEDAIKEMMWEEMLFYHPEGEVATRA
ncbi:hypothetical protein ZIOFF_073677 [Zingiber officinale]|uniref:Uncharacterized protein n=1 Tax=Zingiber officinale TaxID=94328 RepID=A0A8J5C6A8_ZINOF|nr:hypothetical protein ZIOFF_073677 [Zingiber officinale]